MSTKTLPFMELVSRPPPATAGKPLCCAYPYPLSSRRETGGTPLGRYLREAYALFVAAYRDPAEKLRAGDPDPPFPAGCFPPALPVVGA